MISILGEEKVEIEEWSLHAREKHAKTENLQDVKKYVKSLQKKFPNWNWTIRQDDQKWEAIGTEESSAQLQESIQVISSLTNHNLQTYTIYEVKGKNWNKAIEKELDKFDNKISDIFHQNATFYTCVQGHFDDNMDASVIENANNLKNAFQGKERKTILEQDFVSMDVYSPIFHKTVIKEKEMNLQIGMRTDRLGGKTTFVVGTPIITIEY